MLLQPAYKLTLGDKIIDTTDEPQSSTVTDLLVALDMDTPADTARLIMGQVGSFQPKIDDAAEIELGYADGELDQVMVGTIVGTEPGLTERQIMVHSPAEKLLRTYVDQTYENMAAADIVQALAETADVEVARARSGDRFPAYVVDSRRNAYQHMIDLAALSGFDLYVDAAGELVFEAFVGGQTVHVLNYGEQIIELSTQQGERFAGEVQTWGESPAGSQATEDWAWLTKDFQGSKGQNGNGEPLLLIERSALRTGELAQTAAEAISARIQRRTVRGKLLTFGQPKIKLGDAIRIEDVPERELNGTFQVRSVLHRITKTNGFTTEIGFRSIGASSLIAL